MLRTPCDVRGGDLWVHRGAAGYSKAELGRGSVETLSASAGWESAGSRRVDWTEVVPDVRKKGQIQFVPSCH